MITSSIFGIQRGDSGGLAHLFSQVFTTSIMCLCISYFGGASFLRPLLDFTGCIQLVIGIGAEPHGLWSREEDEVQFWSHTFSASLLGSYLILWPKETRMRQTYYST